MTRLTSREAYDHLVSRDLLRCKQRLVIAQLLLGDATSGEVVEALSTASYTMSLKEVRSLRNVNAWRARFTELQQRGLIVEVGTRPCKVTSRRSLVWRFTGRTKPLRVTRTRRGVKAWKALAMDAIRVTMSSNPALETIAALQERARLLGGKP